MLLGLISFVELLIIGFLVVVCVRFIRRCIEMERIINEMDDRTGELVDYCETLRDKSIIYHSPEVLHFHRLVIAMTRPIDKLRPEMQRLTGKDGQADG